MKILVVDDNESLARGLKVFLEQEKHECLLAHQVKDGLRLLGESSFDLVITDLKLPDGLGLDIVSAARKVEYQPVPEVILMTAFGSVQSAVEAIKLGAMDYLTKPVSLEEFSFRLQKVENLRRLELQNSQLQRRHQQLLELAGLNASLNDIAGQSCAITQVKNLISKVAPYPSTVLITGETGAGKELVARAVHNLSDRRDGPFVRVNCASIPETLFESELFGYEKGAFTDARQSRAGCFESADGGTVFLDEVGEIPVNLQAKLLRVLQEKEIVRLGSSKARPVNVRIVAATNRDLDQMVSRNSFREDLLYRLSVFKIHIPPLRERKEDLEAICLKLLQGLSADLKKNELKLSPAALKRLQELDWPGNIRELRNLLERAAVMADSCLLEPAHFGLSAPRDAGSTSLAQSREVSTAETEAGAGLIETLEDLERKLILAALARNDNVKSRAADELKIPRTQLLYRMKRLGIDNGQ
ncbi:MAG: sigma-54-dependent transcriptional regulator [Candidatus Rifleibacteriota bacterium]